MATTARRTRREARKPKGPEGKPEKNTSPKTEQGRIAKAIEKRLQSSANKRDEALAKAKSEKVNPADKLRLEAISERRSAAAQISEEKIDAIIEQEKRYKISGGWAIEKSGDASHTECEDERLVNVDLALFAVIDGLSEPAGSAAVSKQIAADLEAEWASQGPRADRAAAEMAMRNVMRQVNAKVNATFNRGRADDDHLGAAATILKIETGRDGKRYAVVGHTGDTRLYVRHKDGTLEQKTGDHGIIKARLQKMNLLQAEALRRKFANIKDLSTLDDTTPLIQMDHTPFPDEDGHKVTERWLYDQGNTVTQHFGSLNYNPDVFSFELDDEDQLVLTSDGIHDLIPDDQITGRLAEAGTPGEKAQRLVADSKSGMRMGPNGKDQDDRTVVVIELGADRLSGEVAVAKQEYRRWARLSVYGNDQLPVPVTVAQQEGLVALLNEEPAVRDKIKAGVVERYVKLKAQDIDTFTYWQRVGFDDLVIDQAVQRRVKRVDLDAIDRKGIYARKIEDMIAQAATPGEPALPASADVMRESVKYIETTEIAQDAVLLNGIMGILEQVAGRTGDAEISVPTLVGLTDVKELAAKLGFKPETVAELLINQVQAISEASRQQEKSQRSLKLNIAKAVAYAGTGLAITATGLAAPWLALGAVAAARTADAFITTRFHEANRKKIEAAMRKQLKEGVLAFKGTAEPERTYDKVPDGLQKFVDSFVALLALAKRDQIGEHTAQFETAQDDLNAALEAAVNGDTIARTRYAGLVSSQAEILAAQRMRDLEGSVASVEAVNWHSTKRAVDKYIADTTPPTGTLPYDQNEYYRLHDAHVTANEAWLNKREEVMRIAAAEKSLFIMDKTTQLVEAQTRLSADSRKSWWDRNPSIRAMLGGGDTAKEKVTSIGVFMGAGFIARQWAPARVMLTAYAGARAGEALARVEQRVNQMVEGKRAQLTDADIASIKLTDATVFDRLDAVAPRVAAARRRLVDGDLRTQNPVEFTRLLKLVEQFDSLRVTAQAQRSLARISYHTGEIFAAHDKNVADLEKNRKHIRRCALLGALAGELIGVEAVELIAQRAEAAAHAVGTEYSADSLSAADTGDGSSSAASGEDAVTGVGANRGLEASAGSTGAADGGTASSVEAAQPGGTAGTGSASEPGAAAGTGAATTTLVEGSVKGDGSVELPGIKTLTAREWHAAVVHGGTREGHRWGEGVWHALKEQADAPKILSLLKGTHVKMDGANVAIFDPEHGTQLGVKSPDNLAAIIDKDAAGHESLRFFDAQTHKEIPADDLHKYFYKMGIKTEAVAVGGGSGYDTATAALDTRTATANAGVESEGLAHSLWRDGMSKAEFISAWMDAHRPPLDDVASAAYDTTLQGHSGGGSVGFSGRTMSYSGYQLMEQANAAYDRISHTDTGGDDGTDAAGRAAGAPVGPGPRAVGAHGAMGGGGRVAEPGSAGSRTAEPGAVVVDADGKLSDGEKAAVDFAKRGYDADDAKTFIYNVRQLLTEVGGKKPHFTSDNNLAFSTKGVGIYVDVPGTHNRPPVLLTEQLYVTMQAYYDNTIEARTSHTFTPADWEKVLEQHKQAGAARPVASR